MSICFSIRADLISLIGKCRPAQAVRLLISAQPSLSGTDLHLQSATRRDDDDDSDSDQSEER